MLSCTLHSPRSQPDNQFARREHLHRICTLDSDCIQSSTLSIVSLRRANRLRICNPRHHGSRRFMGLPLALETRTQVFQAVQALRIETRCLTRCSSSAGRAYEMHACELSSYSLASLYSDSNSYFQLLYWYSVASAQHLLCRPHTPMR